MTRAKILSGALLLMVLSVAGLMPQSQATWCVTDRVHSDALYVFGDDEFLYRDLEGFVDVPGPSLEARKTTANSDGRNVLFTTLPQTTTITEFEVTLSIRTMVAHSERGAVAPWGLSFGRLMVSYSPDDSMYFDPILNDAGETRDYRVQAFGNFTGGVIGLETYLADGEGLVWHSYRLEGYGTNPLPNATPCPDFEPTPTATLTATPTYNSVMSPTPSGTPTATAPVPSGTPTESAPPPEPDILVTFDDGGYADYLIETGFEGLGGNAGDAAIAEPDGGSNVAKVRVNIPDNDGVTNISFEHYGIFSSVYVEIKLYDASDNLLDQTSGLKNVTANGWSKLSYQFAYVEAAYATIRVANGGSEDNRIDNIEIYYDEPYCGDYFYDFNSLPAPDCTIEISWTGQGAYDHGVTGGRLVSYGEEGPSRNLNVNIDIDVDGVVNQIQLDFASAIFDTGGDAKKPTIVAYIWATNGDYLVYPFVSPSQSGVWQASASAQDVIGMDVTAVRLTVGYSSGAAYENMYIDGSWLSMDNVWIDVADVDQPPITPTPTPSITSTPDPNATPTGTPSITSTPDPNATQTPQATYTPYPTYTSVPGSDGTGNLDDVLGNLPGIGSAIGDAIDGYNDAIDDAGVGLRAAKDLSDSWRLAPAIPPPMMPNCTTDPLLSEVCAIWYILENTLFSGIGVFYIPAIILMIDLLIIIRIVVMTVLGVKAVREWTNGG